MKTVYFFLLLSFYIWFASTLYAQPLAGTDGLGRVLPGNKQVGGVKEDRKVALFYFLWQGNPSSPTSENYWDLSELSKNHPDVFDDFDHPRWGGGAGITGKYYFWGKPLYGYYHGSDYWVHLKNIQLLTDAGVDMLVIDATNRFTYPQQANVLMQAMNAVRLQGKEPPKIVFYTNTRSGEAMQEIYDNCYREGSPYRHPENWFYLDGKPLIIGLSNQAKGLDYESFFTIRESQWPNESQKINGWPWIEFERPQKIYFNNKGEKEIINVSVAQHPNLSASMGGSAFYGMPGNWGRSYRKGSSGNPKEDLVYGYNFQEQWDYALEQDLPFIFVTAWNEWIVGKWRKPEGNPKHSHFVDQASPEYSRDIEPSLTAGLKDHYYMQLVANIRKYKGIDPFPLIGKKITIKNFRDWTKVGLAYSDYTGDIIHRDHLGAQSSPVVNYVNQTGRNDFDKIKVARDDASLYFYARTVADVSAEIDDKWMILYLDLDRSHHTGWLGYDYRVLSGDLLQHYVDDKWVTVSKINYKVSGKEMMVEIPVKQLGVNPDKLDFEFKWSDNMQENDPLDWYINGDTAPGGRFNFVVRSNDFY